MVIYIETDPLISAQSWWDAPMSASSTLESTQQARKTYEEYKTTQRLSCKEDMCRP
jgi:3D-(3,5/4)-trihydroxycyclohexane-1,2-dione acylhydrolase (decyclizing)